MGGHGGAAGGGDASYSNFSSYNDMLKGFMELQKQQLQVDKAKAEANKAKVSKRRTQFNDQYLCI